MTKATYDLELIKIINLFESTTKARVKDAFYMKETLTFIVFEGDIFKALGKNLENLRRVESMLKKKIKIVLIALIIVVFIAAMILLQN